MNEKARNLPDSMAPHHQHDCESCIYLGSSTKQSAWCPTATAWDFYFCDRGNGDGSIIARHGEYGDYYSSPLDLFTARKRDASDPLEWAYCHFIVAEW